MDIMLSDVWDYGKWGVLVYLLTIVVVKLHCGKSPFPWLLHMTGMTILVAGFTAYGAMHAKVMEERDQQIANNVTKLEEAGYSYVTRLDGHPHPQEALASCRGDILFADYRFKAHAVEIDVQAPLKFVTHVFCKKFLKDNPPSRKG